MPVFETVVKMNIVASLTAAAVLMVKYALERFGLPRRVLFLLWLVIAFRLVCPTAPQSHLSVMNLFSQETKVEQSVVHTNKKDKITATEQIATTEVEQNAAVGSDKTPVLPNAIAVIWICGVFVMLTCGAISYARLKRRLRFAVKYRGNVYFADNIPTAFVLGVLRPKIYIPSGMARLEYVIGHERTHIRRLDHVSKLLAYVLLSVNWFNPINWLLFKRFSDDIELACDECVTASLNSEARKEYMSALLDAATGKNSAKIPYHVCFSESITKRRIKAMLKVKKLSAPVAAAAVICCVIAGAVFGTSAVTAKQPPIPQSAEPTEAPKLPDEYVAQKTTPETDYIPSETEPTFGEDAGDDTFSSTQRADEIINTPMASAKETLPATVDNSSGTSNYDNFNSQAPTASNTVSKNELPQNTPPSSEDEHENNKANDNNADVVEPIAAEKTDELSFDKDGKPILPEGWLTEEEMQDKFGYIVVHFGQSEITADHSTDEEKAAIRESYDKVADRVGSEEALERFEQALGKEYMEELISR